MFQLSQIVIGSAQLVKLLLSVNLLLVVSLLGAVVHTAPVNIGQDLKADTNGHFVFQSHYTVLTDSLDDGSKKQVYEIRPIIPPAFYKYHFIFALFMFFFIALIAASPSVTARALLLLPVVLCYGISHVLFACDQAEMLDGMMARYKRRITKPAADG